MGEPAGPDAPRELGLSGSNRKEARLRVQVTRSMRDLRDPSQCSASGELDGGCWRASDPTRNRSDDPVWNDAHSRNRRILIDDQTRYAHASDEPTLVTYLMVRGDERFPVKNVFIPLFIKGKRWGNYEIAYRDD